jgi:hypothetical protein
LVTSQNRPKKKFTVNIALFRLAIYSPKKGIFEIKSAKNNQVLFDIFNSQKFDQKNNLKNCHISTRGSSRVAKNIEIKKKKKIHIFIIAKLGKIFL